MVTCFKWFMRVINNTMDNQKKAMEELVTDMSFEGIKNICLGMVIRLLNSLHLILRYGEVAQEYEKRARWQNYCKILEDRIALLENSN